MSFVSKCKDLAGALAPAAQNGKSLWGTLLAQTLPLWVIGNHGALDCPWGELAAKTSNPYEDAPFTAMTRTYEFNVSRGVIAPDGYEKSVILVNEQFPGPLIEANWGDWIEVKVNNRLEDEGTAIHWHGFLQSGTLWSDGVPGVTQCPVAPGTSYTYRFRAELYGSSWWHSHYSAQYSGGMFGPIVVHGPNHVKYDVDLGPVMVNDWWHEEYFTVVEEVMAAGSSGQTFSDNNLINGKMTFDCDPSNPTPCTPDAGLSKFHFQSGKTHRLRFVNTGSEAVQRISIDGHNMTIIANDFVPIEPYETQVVTLGVGQRADVIVHAQHHPGSAFWLRANISSCSNAQQPYALAAVYYDHADTDKVPDSEPWNVPDPGTCANDDLSLTKPLYPIDVPEPDWTEHMDISAFRNETDNFLWKFGGVTARVNYNEPTLMSVVRGNLDVFTMEDNVRNYGTNSSIRLIVNNPTPAPHPMHAHGMNFFVLAAGPGNYDPDNNTTIPNSGDVIRNPMRRDVQNIEPNGHMVIQVDAARHPGLWPFHCHIAWHASQGFFAQLLLDPEWVAETGGGGRMKGKGTKGKKNGDRHGNGAAAAAMAMATSTTGREHWVEGSRLGGVGVSTSSYYRQGEEEEDYEEDEDKVPAAAQEACRLWDRWSRGETVEQIDSGV